MGGAHDPSPAWAEGLADSPLPRPPHSAPLRGPERWNGKQEQEEQETGTKTSGEKGKENEGGDRMD